jgi:hypothetical protein
MYGLETRVLGIESLLFLADVYEQLKTPMLSLVPEAYAPYVETFYSATVEGTPALREHCYRNVACRLINYEAVLQEMAAVRWDRRDIASEACFVKWVL